MEDAIWKENTKDFLIVSEDVLAMPDCTLMIQSLSDREIEIHVDPNKQGPTVEVMDKDKYIERPEITPRDEGDRENLKCAMDDNIDESETKTVTGTTEEHLEKPTIEEVDSTVGEAPIKDVDQEEDQMEDILAGPKIKIGTGNPQKPNWKMKTEDSESDTPHYSM